LALAPWALWIVVAATPIIVRSLTHLERFPETGNPGYFIIKLSLWVLALGVLASIVLEMNGSSRKDGR
jgi:hypothetical protein